MAHRELIIPGRVVPKARPRFNRNTGNAYTEPKYRAWLDMAAEVVALTLRKPMMEGPMLLRCAFTPAGVEVAIMDTSPVEWKGQRGDLDNLTGSVMDALQQGAAIKNDRHIVRLETWIV
jgi:Holliday junction resolvase RusA-like endonuclease